MYALARAVLDAERNPFRAFIVGNPTTDLFQFDHFWKGVLFLEQTVSGVITYDFQSPGRWTTSYQSNAGPAREQGALFLDCTEIFEPRGDAVWNTTLRHSRTSLPRENLLKAVGDLYIEDRPAFFSSPVKASGLMLPASAVTRSPDITTPYAELLKELYLVAPWRSWKKLAPLLGASHTQLRRIAEGAVSVPGDDLAARIDELHWFARRLQDLSRGNVTAMTRLLTTRRSRDRRSANDFLAMHDYRNAFRATMEAASPRPSLASVQGVPRRWYDEPSTDIYDDGTDSDD